MVMVFLSACGEPAESLDKTDSVNEADLAFKGRDTSVYARMSNGATEVKLPAMIKSDEMQKLPGLKMNAQSGYALLPGEFEPESYSSVNCIGRSAISAEVNALWFCLKSPGENEGSPETVDIMMVLYDKAGKPFDVCTVASEALGYSYSYVHTDSLFTVEVDETDKINITTYGVALSRNGFMPEGAATRTFQPDENGKKASEAFRNEFLNTHQR